MVIAKERNKSTMGDVNRAARSRRIWSAILRSGRVSDSPRARVRRETERSGYKLFEKHVTLKSCPSDIIYVMGMDMDIVETQ